MIDALISDEAKSSSCCDSSRVSRTTAFELEAAKVDAANICDAVVVLVVFRFADVDPFFRIGNAVDD